MKSEECQSLEQVRQQIDKINSSILTLLAERQTYVIRAAQLKTNTSQIIAPNRQAQIIEKIKCEAVKLGLDIDVATTIFESIINAFIKLEQKKHEELKLYVGSHK